MAIDAGRMERLEPVTLVPTEIKIAELAIGMTGHISPNSVWKHTNGDYYLHPGHPVKPHPDAVHQLTLEHTEGGHIVDASGVNETWKDLESYWRPREMPPYYDADRRTEWIQIIDLVLPKPPDRFGNW